MIDEKKMRNAMERYLLSIAPNFWDKEDANEVLRGAQDGFEAGANWSLQELKKSLWHDASEEPTRYDDYLVKTKQGCVDVCFFDIDGWHEPKVGGGDVAMWLDLKDILPTKGGEQC